MLTRPLIYVFALIAGPLLLTLVASDNVASVFLAATGNLGSPSNLKVTEVTASSIDLKWNDNSNNETGFQIQRKVGSGSFSTVKTVDANTETYRSNGLSSGKKYTHRVRAVKGSNNSSYSNSVSTTTLSTPPITNAYSLIDHATRWNLFNIGGGSVTQLSTGVRLTAPAAGDIYLMAKTMVDTSQGFQVDFDYTVLDTHALPDSGTWTTLGLLRGDGTAGFPVNISEWIPTATLEDNLRAHSSGVRATYANKNASNTSMQSDEYRLRTFPDYVRLRPDDASYTGDPKITLNAGVPYHVTFKLTGTVLKLTVTSSAGTQQGSYTASSFAMPTARTLFLKHSGGRNGEITNFVVATATADTIAPSIPTNLTTSNITTSQINLAWSASTDNVGVAGYKVYRDEVHVASPATPSYLNTGLTPSTAYTFKVAAYDAAGNQSPFSSSISTTTHSTPPPPPVGSLSLPVSTCTILAGGSTCSILVSWSITNPVAPSVRQNNVQFSTLPTGSSVPRVLSYGTNTFTLLDGSLSLDTKTATASCVAGTSWSEGVCKTITAEIVLPGTGLTMNKKGTEKVYTDFIAKTKPLNYRLIPADGRILENSQPFFVWPTPTDRKESVPWKLTILQGSKEIFSQTNKHSGFLYPSTLPSGDYEWTVEYRTTKDVAVKSAPRRFTVPVGAMTTPIPDGEVIVSKIKARSHPREVPSGFNMAAVVSLAKADPFGKAIYDKVIKMADGYLGDPLPVEPIEKSPEDFGGDRAAYNDYKKVVIRVFRDETIKINHIGYAYLSTGNSSYRDNGIKRIMNLASFNPNGSTREDWLDDLNHQNYLSLARGYDIFYNELTSSQKSQIIASLKNRLGQYRENENADIAPYDSHGASQFESVVASLLRVVGDPNYPEAETLLAEMWNQYLTQAVNVWGEQDGTFGNGTSYGWYAFEGHAEMAAIVKIYLDISLGNHPWIKNMGKSVLSFTAPKDGVWGAFGDGVEIAKGHYEAYYDDARLFALLMQDKEMEWYWRANPDHTNPPTKKQIDPINLMTYALKLTRPGPAVPQNNFISDETGLVAFHDNVINLNRSSVFFRSSSFGSHNHMHADQNSFNFVSKGVNLLISGGYYDSYATAHHSAVGRATRFKNTLTFNGGIGQAEPETNPTKPGNPLFSRAAYGKLINFFENETKAIVTGDATAAYRAGDSLNPLLTSAIRTIVYDKSERVVLIYDYASSATARKWELNFNALADFTILANSSVSIARNGASASIEVYGPIGKFTKTKDFPIAPSGGYPTADQPTQYQSRFSVDTSSTALTSVTVVREDARSVPVSVKFNGTVAEVSINGQPSIVFNQKTVTLNP